MTAGAIGLKTGVAWVHALKLSGEWLPFEPMAHSTPVCMLVPACQLVLTAGAVVWRGVPRVGQVGPSTRLDGTQYIEVLGQYI